MRNQIRMCETKEAETEGFTENRHYFEGGMNPSPDQKCMCGEITIEDARRKKAVGEINND